MAPEVWGRNPGELRRDGAESGCCSDLGLALW